MTERVRTDRVGKIFVMKRSIMINVKCFLAAFSIQVAKLCPLFSYRASDIRAFSQSKQLKLRPMSLTKY